MRKDHGLQLSLFGPTSPPDKSDRPAKAKVVSLAEVRAREEARQRAELDFKIIARAAHLLPPGFLAGKFRT